MKRILTLVLVAALSLLTFVGCSGSGDTSAGGSSEGVFDASKNISVNSREDGSGTRGAFIELFGIEVKDADGNKVDMTTEDAAVTNNTSVMMSTVAGNPYAIGYISLGSLNDTVKALKIDGAKATVANIKSGTYKISRPFNIATKEGLSAVAQDFVDFILSAEGQQVVSDNGYIPLDDAPAYTGSKPAGKVTVAGSSSVTPLMEKLKEAYLAVNTGADIQIQENDSTTGMNNTIDGVCDIGMASRALKDSEIEKGLIGTTIATDGIAVIVNNSCGVDNMTSEQVKGIYTGELTKWSEVNG